jgi:hypothetical protein
MALLGKWTKIEQVQSETETEKVKIEHPAELPKGHPDFDKAGTTEEIEVPKIDIVETVFEDVYVIVNSINSWKHIIDGETKTLFNITFRVYESKEHRESDFNNYLQEPFILSQSVDYSLDKNEIQQAYDLIKIKQGFEELIND